MTLDDDSFIDRFARLDLGPEHFDHRGHLRMAWLHLTRYDLEEANARVCRGIRALAIRFGVPDKFNHTLTEALMRIMAARMADTPGGDFDAFLAGNADLVDDARAVLARHYGPERLNSEAARHAWLPPDRLPIA